MSNFWIYVKHKIMLGTVKVPQRRICHSIVVFNSKKSFYFPSHVWNTIWLKTKIDVEQTKNMLILF